jgi:ribonucleoside-diphosphate reductase alpha chain
MDISQKILSDITAFSKYAKHLPAKKRRETWEEVCDRNLAMHVKKFPIIADEITETYKKYVYTRKVLPSMRSMQFAGRPAELSNNRIYNCAYLAVDSIEAFHETLFLLLGGTGIGFSVQQHHIAKLPIVVGTRKQTRRFLVGDSIEGWGDAVKVLVKAFFQGKAEPTFDFRDIRPKGALLVTSGGKAPGPDPLRICIEHIRAILHNAVGRKLTSLEIHDIMCHIADAVLSGGIRRAALISLFSPDDLDMISCKSGDWWELNPQRGRSNNSAVLHREHTTEDQFKALWERIKDSNAGEPGIFWTNDLDLGTNPCCEISLNSNQFCNLTEMNVSDVETQEELNDMAKAASLIGTLQAAYTDFHYLRPEWEENTKREALIGVGQTGIGSGKVLKLDLAQSAQVVKDENERVAKLLNINPAARTTAVKPSGSSSLIVGSSSGVHAWHNDFYIRRMRVGKNEALYSYMAKNFPSLIEDCKFKPHLDAVMSFPQKAPEGSILRSESAHDTLERVKKFNKEWVQNGHRTGKNFHNVSCTISLRNREWESVQRWMWKNRADYTGISVLPYDGGSYVQAPFEDCTEETFNEMMKHLHNINLADVIEIDDNTALNDQVACGQGGCAI